MEDPKLDELYKLKGKIATQIEILQGNYRNINDQIAQILNAQSKPTANEEVEDAKESED